MTKPKPQKEKEQGEQQIQQELMFKLQMFEQQASQIQQQLQAVGQAVIELSSLSLGLDELKGAEGNEIMTLVGRGIFVKTKLLSEELTVDVGGKNFVKKSIDETKELIEEQVKKLEDARKDLEDNLEMLGNELDRMVGRGD